MMVWSLPHLQVMGQNGETTSPEGSDYPVAPNQLEFFTLFQNDLFPKWRDNLPDGSDHPVAPNRLDIFIQKSLAVLTER